MARAKKNISDVSAKDIDEVTEILGRLVLSAKFSHMKVHVQAIMGGVMLPKLIDLGEVDPEDPDVKTLVEAYSKSEVKKLLNPDPIAVEVPIEIEKIIHERPVYRRIKNGVNKEKRIQRGLDPAGRDILIRWWNVNQRLIPKDDPVCVTLTDQVNSLNPNNEPLSPMQISGYMSHLCRMGLRTAEEREDRLRSSLSRGDHTVMPKYTQELLDAIRENWEYERKLEETRLADHDKLRQLRAQGINKPVAANV